MNKYYKCYRNLRRLTHDITYKTGKVIGPVWYRFFGFKHHIIKTSLTPAVWYDTDTRILYAVMDSVKWYVDNDMMTPWTEESVKEEIVRVKEEEPKEFQERAIECIEYSHESDRAAIEITEWWNNYPAREKEADEEGYHKTYDSLQDRLDKEEQEMLFKAIKYRKTMWS